MRRGKEVLWTVLWVVGKGVGAKRQRHQGHGTPTSLEPEKKLRYCLNGLSLIAVEALQPSFGNCKSAYRNV